MSLFLLEGEYWTIAYDGRVVRLRNRRGLHFLAHLVARPGVPVPARQLSAVGRPRAARCADTEPDPDADERARVRVTKGLKSSLRAIRNVHASLGAHFDATIRCGFRCSYRPDPRVPIAWQMRREV